MPGSSESSIVEQFKVQNDFIKGFVTPQFGLLPTVAPALALPGEFAVLDNAANHLKNWVKECNLEQFKKVNDELNIPLLLAELDKLTASELARAKLIVGKIGHAYGYISSVRGETTPHFDTQYPNLFSLWQKLAEKMNHSPQFPILTSSDTTYCNWRYKNPNEQHNLDNLKDLEKLEQLVPLFDNREEIVTNLGVVVFEAHIAPMISAIQTIVKAIETNNIPLVSEQLDIILTCVQGFTNTFLEFYNFHPGSGKSFIDLKAWGSTVIKALNPCYPKEIAQVGTDVSLFNVLDAFIGRDKHDSRLGKLMKSSESLLPMNHRVFIQYVKDAHIADFIKQCTDPLLKIKFQQIVEAYSGEHGFLGVHKEVAMSGVTATAGFNTNQSGIKLDAKIGEHLEEARKERKNPELTNVIRFQLARQEKVSSEENQDGSNFSVALQLKGGEQPHAKSIITAIQPGTCIYIPIKNSLKHVTAFKKSFLDRNIDFNTEVDIKDNEIWMEALSKWPETSGKTKFTLKELLFYVDLTQLARALHQGEPIKLKVNFLPAPDRIYSVNSVDVENGIVNLLIKRQVYENGELGSGSYFLTNEDNLGQEVSCHILPPISFTLPKDKNKPIVLFAGSNGIAPFTHFLSELNKNGFTNRVCLVYLTRSDNEDWLESQLKQHTQHLPNFECCVIHTGKSKRIEWLTEHKVASVNSSQDKLLAIDKVIDSFKTEEFCAYVCGSVSFTKGLLSTLKKALGEDRFSKMIGHSQLAYEAFTSTEADKMKSKTSPAHKEFTLEEINQHNTQESCWVTVDGEVYDITDFLDIHKAGGEIFLSQAFTNRDMTEMYRVVHKGRSPTADSWLQSYHIGSIKAPNANLTSETTAPNANEVGSQSAPAAGFTHPPLGQGGTCPFLNQRRAADSSQEEKPAENIPSVRTRKSWCGFFERSNVPTIAAIGVALSAAVYYANHRS